MKHALTWVEALEACRRAMPGAEQVAANDFSMFAAMETPERAALYEYVCGSVELTLDFLATHAGKPFPQ